MARTIGRLTSNLVRNAKPGPNGRTVLLCDGGGLWLQVGRGKDGKITKSWIFRYSVPGTKISRTGSEYRRERQMGLGPLHTVGLADRSALSPDGSPLLDKEGRQIVLPGARTLAAQARAIVRVGKDPIEEKRASRLASRAANVTRKTFAQMAELYLQKFEDGWRNRTHRRQWRATLRDFINPVLGPLDVDAIDTADVLRVLEPIWSVIPETASRIRGRIESVLDFAGRNSGNPARWTGHLEYRLAKRKPQRRLSALPFTGIGAIMALLRGRSDIAARALEFAVLTAARTGEVLGARWSEFELAGRTWKIPVERLKRRGEEDDGGHTIPLSDRAAAIIEQMASVRQDDRVFPIGPSAMLLCLKALQPDVTVHGFRATFRSWAGSCTAHPRDVCEAALGHAIGSAVERAYMRDSLLQKRRVLMNDWAAFCAKPAGDVVHIGVGNDRKAQENDVNSTNSADMVSVRM